MNSNIVIKKLRASILTAAAADNLNSLLAQLSDHPKQHSKEEWEKILSDSHYILLAAINPVAKKIVGMASLCLKYTAMKSAADMEDVVVSDEYRGKGIAKALFNKIIEAAKEKNMECVYWTSNPDNPKRANAIAFYDKLIQEGKAEKINTNVYRTKIN